MGCEGESIHSSNFGMSPVFINDNISVMSVGMILESPSDALIYRGPKKTGKKFFRLIFIFYFLFFIFYF